MMTYFVHPVAVGCVSNQEQEIAVGAKIYGAGVMQHHQMCRTPEYTPPSSGKRALHDFHALLEPFGVLA
jgi:hypothetical protein